MTFNENIIMISWIFCLVGSTVLLFMSIVFGIPWIIRNLTYDLSIYKTTIVDDKVDVVFSQGRNFVSSNMIYLLSFKFEDDEIVEFSLPCKEYKKLHIGDVGELTFQVDKFIRFKKIQINV